MNEAYRTVVWTSLMLCFFGVDLTQAQLGHGWKAHDKKRPQPKVVEPGKSNLPASVPSDAIVLFDGTDLSKWNGTGGKEPKWVVKDGVLETVAGAGFIHTKEKFADCQLHVEWASPSVAKGKGQQRGNSGVFLPGGYEVQVLDSFENETYADGGAGSIYGQHPPDVNASRKPGQWQSYDIIFKMPTFKENKLVSPAVITVLHNGVVVQNAAEAFGPTSWVLHKDYDASVKSGSIGLQDHGNPVRFRNIWIRKLDTKKTSGSYAKERPFTKEEMNRFVGKYEKDHQVTQRDGSLWLVWREQQMEMAAFENGTYGFRKTSGTVSFVDGESGPATELQFNLDAGKRGKFRRIE